MLTGNSVKCNFGCSKPIVRSLSNTVSPFFKMLYDCQQKPMLISLVVFCFRFSWFDRTVFGCCSPSDSQYSTLSQGFATVYNMNGPPGRGTNPTRPNVQATLRRDEGSWSWREKQSNLEAAWGNCSRFSAKTIIRVKMMGSTEDRLNSCVFLINKSTKCRRSRNSLHSPQPQKETVEDSTRLLLPFWTLTFWLNLPTA